MRTFQEFPPLYRISRPGRFAHATNSKHELGIQPAKRPVRIIVPFAPWGLADNENAGYVAIEPMYSLAWLMQAPFRAAQETKGDR